MKIDVFTHIMPKKYTDAFVDKARPDFPGLRWLGLDIVPAVYDLDLRFQIMDKFEDYVQILTLPGPPLETVFEPKKAVELAKLVNDEMAELVMKYPYRFIAAVACLPMDDIDAALKELERAIDDLNFRGVEVFSSINGKPLDSPEFMPIYEKMASYNLPIWIHPWRKPDLPEYPTEDHSKYSLWDKFGWPFETTIAMTRLVMSGVLERYPNVKFITHHTGGMIPYFANRVEEDFDFNEREGHKYKQNLRKPVLDYYRMFYNDTAIYGNTAGLMCAYAFCGAEHLLFGTDMPYDNQIGYRHTRETIRSIEEMSINDSEKKLIFEDNAKKIMRLPC